MDCLLGHTSTGTVPRLHCVSESQRGGKWLPVIVLGLAQFIMVLDTTVMNVSISTVVKDLDTTVTGLQLAITSYALVMASFMLTGGRIGDIIGRRRAFAVGLVVYGIGSLITSLSPNLETLLFGWSLVEGLGATLVIPAIMALTAAAYQGKDRAMAYGVLGGIAGAGAAVGPLIGGAVTTYASWRYVFAGETVTVVILLVIGLRHLPSPQATGGRVAPLEVLVTSLGMSLIVLGVLKASEWGFLSPVNPPEISGHTIAPFGLSPTPFLVGGGAALLAIFMRIARRSEAAGGAPLASPRMLALPRLRAGVAVTLLVQVALGGLFFTLPVFLQVTLGKDAFATGLQLIPLSIALVVSSLAGAGLASRRSPKLVVTLGFGLMGIGLLLLSNFVSEDFRDIGFSIGMAVCGCGMGLVMSQTSNIVMSSVEESSTGQAGGVQGTGQNLGMSLGTAFIGAVLLAGMTTGFNAQVSESTQLPTQVKQLVQQETEAGVAIVPESEVVNAATKAGLSPSEVSSVADIYMEAQVDALRSAIAITAAVAFAALFLCRRLDIETADPVAGAPQPAAA